MSTNCNNVYIVDDDESVCCALKTLLKTYGFEVKTFNSAKSFFIAISTNEPGCLILDINMPEVDGWATLRRISESGSGRPVILISADKQVSSDDLTIKTSAIGFLQKPFDGQMLVDLINAAIVSPKK